MADKFVQDLAEDPDDGIASLDDLIYIAQLKKAATGNQELLDELAVVEADVLAQARYFTGAYGLLKNDVQLAQEMGGVNAKNARKLAEHIMKKSKVQIELERDNARVKTVAEKVLGAGGWDQKVAQKAWQ